VTQLVTSVVLIRVENRTEVYWFNSGTYTIPAGML